MTGSSLSPYRKLRIVATALATAILGACAQTPRTAPDDGATKAVVLFQSCAKPGWPDEDFRAGHDGTVTINFLVGADGKARQATILKSSGYPAMDEAARDGIFKCEFKPATVDGKPVERWTQMQYVWSHS